MNQRKIAPQKTTPREFERLREVRTIAESNMRLHDQRITTRLYALQTPSTCLSYVKLRLAAPEGKHQDAAKSILTHILREPKDYITIEDVTERDPMFDQYHPLPDVVWLAHHLEITIHAPWFHNVIALCQFANHMPNPDIDLNMAHETGCMTVTEIGPSSGDVTFYTLATRYIPTPHRSSIIWPRQTILSVMRRNGNTKEETRLKTMHPGHETYTHLIDRLAAARRQIMDEVALKRIPA